jgi:hypothetical protein
MNDDAVKETFDELFTLLEALETQSAAILQCLRDPRTRSWGPI